RHVADQQQGADPVPRRKKGDAPGDEGHLLGPDLGVTAGPSPEHGTEGLLVVPATGWHEVTGEVDQDLPGQVALVSEPTVGRQGVGAGVGHAAGEVQPYEAVPHPW